MLLPGMIPAWAGGTGDSQPALRFSTEPREPIAIASYPFRDFIAGKKDAASAGKKMELKDFAAHVAEKFNIRKIEPWSEHFRSLDQKYLAEIRSAVEKARGVIVNIAVDGEHSPYAADKSERGKSVAQRAVGGCGGYAGLSEHSNEYGPGARLRTERRPSGRKLNESGRVRHTEKRDCMHGK